MSTQHFVVLTTCEDDLRRFFTPILVGPFDAESEAEAYVSRVNPS